MFSALFKPLQSASVSTLEDAEGVYVSMLGPDDPLTAPVSMARFSALRSLWLRQATMTTLRGVQLSRSTTLRHAAPDFLPSNERTNPHPTVAQLHHAAGG